MRTYTNTAYSDEIYRMIAQAEELKNKKIFGEPKRIYEEALALSPDDAFLIQRYALVTYKLGFPTVTESLLQAQSILSVLNPYNSVDPETLGLSGAINKRLYEACGNKGFLEKSIWFYSRGFSAANDYYNGINLAYLYLLQSTIEVDEVKAFVCFKNADIINRKIVVVCNELISSPGFSERGDKAYIYQTLAQAYLGNEMNHDVIKLIPTINEVTKGSFDLDAFHEQNNKIIDLIIQFKKKYWS